MKNLFLLGTVLCVTTGAFAFGGIGIGPWQRHKHQGVDIIGVHIDIDGKGQTDIVDHSCPEHSIYNAEYDQCFCKDGYYMSNNMCQPTRNVCIEQGGYWCLNGEYPSCEKNEAACYARCPEDRKCNGVCCGQENVCRKNELNVYQCCNDSSGTCCDADVSIGAYYMGRCCSIDRTLKHCGSSPLGCYEPEDFQGLNSCCGINRTFACYGFDGDGNCIKADCVGKDSKGTCYGVDAKGHCRVLFFCPEGQKPYCGGPWKFISADGYPDCAGPGLACCPGKVIYGEGRNPDVCEE